MEIHIARDGQRVGPFSVEEVRRQLAAGSMSPADLAWTEGAPGWAPVASLPGVAEPGRSPPPPPARTPASVPPAPVAGTFAYGPSRTSGAAVASLILGILSMTFMPVLGSLGAIIFGHVARSDIRRSENCVEGDGMAITGLVLGYLSLVLVLLFMGIVIAGVAALPIYGKTFVKTVVRVEETKAVDQAKTVAAACRAYAADHHEAFPKKLEDLVPQYLPDRASLVCPLHRNDPVGYYYFGGTEKDPPGKVLFMSKYVRFNKRIIAHVDGSCAVELPPTGVTPPGRR